MAGIADRIATVGGTLTVDSPPGKGTRLLIDCHARRHSR